MILKQKSQMTGKELCDIEGLIFPIIADSEENKESQKKAFIGLIKDNGTEIVKLCYTKDDGSKIEEINEEYRFKVMQDFPRIMEFVFEIPKEQDEGKPQPQRIKKR